MVELTEYKLCPFCHYQMKGAGMDKKNNKVLFHRCPACGFWATFVL